MTDKPKRIGTLFNLFPGLYAQMGSNIFSPSPPAAACEMDMIHCSLNVTTSAVVSRRQAYGGL